MEREHQQTHYHNIINHCLPSYPNTSPMRIMCRTRRRGSYLYGRVIFIHKVVLDELDGECTLAHASSPHYHQLILRHLCRCCSPHQHHCWREEREGERCRLAWVRSIHSTGSGQNNGHTQSGSLYHWTAATEATNPCSSGVRNTSSLCERVCVCVVGAEVETPQEGNVKNMQTVLDVPKPSRSE